MDPRGSLMKLEKQNERAKQKTDHWGGGEGPNGTRKNKTIKIKVRATSRLLKSKVNFKNDYVEVEILEKETGVSPGQACVFYLKDDIGDKVLGGGWIDKTFNNKLST